MKRLCTSTRTIPALDVEYCEQDEKLGTETEAEKHMKSLLEKQLDKKITLKEQFAQHRTFTSPSTFRPLTELIEGTCSLESYKNLENKEEKYQELQRCGLSEEEISFYFSHQDNQQSKIGFAVNPEIQKEKLEQINEKIKAHQKELEKNETFSGAKVLGRHAMEIEKSLYAGCQSKKSSVALIKEISDNNLKANDPFAHIKNVSEEISRRIHKERRMKKKKHNLDTLDIKEIEEKLSESEIQYDPSMHHVIVPIEEDEVLRNKLSVEEIKKLQRFQNYEPGEPSKILYLKNLHHKVTIRDLQALFGIFEINNSECISYKLLTGKMKGQAFISFPDVMTAKKALEYGNGYLLRNRPIIIEYGRKYQD